jgi:16S rRNA processing protein RimM
MKAGVALVNRRRGPIARREFLVSSPKANKDEVAVAEVARPHGVRGELRLKVYNPDTEVLAKGRRVLVRMPSAKAEPRRVLLTAVRPIEGGLLVRLEGVETRDDAEAMRGATLYVDRDELPEPEEGEFYAHDVEGARAELVSGDVIGTVERLVSYPTCDVLLVETVEGARIEVPLTDTFVDEVDVEAHVVRLKSIEGL